MKPKRLLSFILSVAIVVSLLPVFALTVNASNVEPVASLTYTSGTVTKTEKFETLQEAFDAAESKKGSTVTLLKHYSGDATVKSGNFSFTTDSYVLTGKITVNEGATFTVNSGIFSTESTLWIASIISDGTLYIKSGTFVANIFSHGSLDITDGNFERVSISGNGTNNIKSGTFKELMVTKTTAKIPNVTISGGKFNYIISVVEGMGVKAKTFSELLADGYSFKYNGNWVDGDSEIAGQRNGTDYITVEKTPIVDYTPLVNITGVYDPKNTNSEFKIEKVKVADGYVSENVKFEWKDNGTSIVNSKNVWNACLTAGTHDVECIMTLDGYKKKHKFDTVNIEKASYTATLSMGDYAYGETPSVPSVSKNPENGTVKYYYSKTSDGSNVTEWKNIDGTTLPVGTYYMYAVIGETSNYKIYSTLSDGTTSFTVEKGDSQTSVGTAETTVTYGDSITLKAEVGTSKAKNVGADKVEFYVVEDEDATLLGTADVVYKDDKKDSGTANLTVKTTDKKLKVGANTITAEYGGSINLNGSDGDTVSITMNQKEVGLSWSGYSERDYDGNESNVTVTLTGVENGDEVGVTVTGEKEINAKTHTATATALTGTHCGYYKLPENKTQNYTIKPRVVETEWKEPSDLTYDGKEKVVTATVKNVVSGDSVTLTLSDNKQINKGDYKAKITATDNQNYTLDGALNLTHDWKIYPKDISKAENVVVTFGDELVYNGKEQRQIIKKIEVDGLNLIFDQKGGLNNRDCDIYNDKGTDAKDYTVKITGWGNFTGKIERTFTIKPLPVNITWKDTENLVYDNTQKTISAEVANKCGTDEINLTISGDIKGKDKGIYNAEVTAVDNKNYTIENGENLKKQWSIAETTNSFTSSLSLDGWTYGETPKTPNITAKYGTPVYSYSNEKDGAYVSTVPTNAGTYWVKATVVGTINYAEVSSDVVSFTIAKATPTQSVTTSARVLKGKTLEEAIVTDGTVVGVDGVTPLEGTFEWVDKTKVMIADGSEPMTFIPTDENYNSIPVNAEVSIYTSGSSTGYTVKFYSNGGSSVASQKVVRKGTATEPDEPTKSGYTFFGWYSDSTLTQKYDFSEKVLGDVTLYAKWTKNESGSSSENGTSVGKDDNDDNKENTDNKPVEKEWENPFTDVKEKDWFFENVKYVVENGLFNGVTEDTFAPNDSITRGMFVTVLYRAYGEPNVNKTIHFSDVLIDTYYEKAVIWAYENGIVSGISENEFAPDENITREQIATMMLRYAKFMGVAPTGEWAIKLDYADTSEISDYALEGVMYCNLKGIMQGKDNNCFEPKSFSTRAEVSAIVERFIKNNK